MESSTDAAAAASNRSKAILLRIVNQATPIQLAVASWIATAIMVFAFLLTPTESGRRGMMNLTESWGALDRMAIWQDSLSWIPFALHGGNFVSLPVPMIVWLFRAGMAAVFVLQACAFWRAWSGPQRSFRLWILGPLGAHLLMLLTPPTNADVFFYAMSGDIANHGANPYVEPLYLFPDNPFLPFNHWSDMTTVYGPLWTNINRTLVWIGQSDPIATVYVFKIVIGLVALALAGLVFALARHITGSVRLATAAGVLVAWQPNMIFESTGQVHNDILMMLFITAAVALAIYGGLSALRGAIVLATASVMIKYLTLPMVGFLGLLRLAERREPQAARRITIQWILDGVAIFAVVTAGFLPYWDGIGILTELFEEPGRLFSHPLWAVQYFALDALFGWRVVSTYVDIVRTVLQIATLALIAWAAIGLIRNLWSGSSPDRELEDEVHGDIPWWTGHLLTAFAIVITTLSLVPVNSHPWYWTWPVVPIALLVSFRRGRLADPEATVALPRWFWWYVFGTGALTLVYNTRIVHS